MVVALGLGLGAWGLFQIGSRQRLWADTYTVTAAFPQAHGVERGTAVRLLGVEVGEVAAVELPPPGSDDGKVRLRLRVGRQFQPHLRADASAELLSDGVLGGRVVNLHPGKAAEPLPEGGELAARPTTDIADVTRQVGDAVQQVGDAVKALRESNGTLGKLVHSDEAYREAVTSLRELQQMIRQGQETFRKGEEALTSMKQDADAIKKLPIIRGYVDPDAAALLYRPGHERHRKVFAAIELFDDGRSVLTGDGRRNLGELAAWLNGLKVKGSEVVVVTFTDPKTDGLTPALARELTLKQSEAVCAHLRDLKAHKMSWFSSRPVTPLGLGFAQSPVPESVALPYSRVEVLVFVPQT
jgi:phospholipid/cholesterol/gamma-HCH transport system substrate-binding protein